MRLLHWPLTQDRMLLKHHTQRLSPARLGFSWNRSSITGFVIDSGNITSILPLDTYIFRDDFFASH
jgi:hypothetical protein